MFPLTPLRVISVCSRAGRRGGVPLSENFPRRDGGSCPFGDQRRPWCSYELIGGDARFRLPRRSSSAPVAAGGRPRVEIPVQAPVKLPAKSGDDGQRSTRRGGGRSPRWRLSRHPESLGARAEAPAVVAGKRRSRPRRSSRRQHRSPGNDEAANFHGRPDLRQGLRPCRAARPPTGCGASRRAPKGGRGRGANRDQLNVQGSQPADEPGVASEKQFGRPRRRRQSASRPPMAQYPRGERYGHVRSASRGPRPTRLPWLSATARRSARSAVSGGWFDGLFLSALAGRLPASLTNPKRRNPRAIGTGFLRCPT